MAPGSIRPSCLDVAGSNEPAKDSKSDTYVCLYEVEGFRRAQKLGARANCVNCVDSADCSRAPAAMQRRRHRIVTGTALLQSASSVALAIDRGNCGDSAVLRRLARDSLLDLLLRAVPGSRHCHVRAHHPRQWKLSCASASRGDALRPRSILLTRRFRRRVVRRTRRSGCASCAARPARCGGSPQNAGRRLSGPSACR